MPLMKKLKKPNKPNRNRENAISVNEPNLLQSTAEEAKTLENMLRKKHEKIQAIAKENNLVGHPVPTLDQLEEQHKKMHAGFEDVEKTHRQSQLDQEERNWQIIQELNKEYGAKTSESPEKQNQLDSFFNSEQPENSQEITSEQQQQLDDLFKLQDKIAGSLTTPGQRRR